MPSFTVQLTANGPLIQAYVGLSRPHAAALVAQNKPVPVAVMGTFLIDSGASGTVVDPDLIVSLNLKPTGAMMIHTPSTNGVPVRCDQFDISFFIPGAMRGTQPAPGHHIPAMPVTASALRASGIDGLLGRDVLASCVFVYNGADNLVTLAY